jgi:hypothetical protein
MTTAGTSAWDNPKAKELARQNGLKGGRPRKELSITAGLRDYLVRHPDAMQRVIASLINMAVVGRNIQAIQEIFNRIDGKVIERHELDTKLPITLLFQPMIARSVESEAVIVDSEAKQIS